MNLYIEDHIKVLLLGNIPDQLIALIAGTFHDWQILADWQASKIH